MAQKKKTAKGKRPLRVTDFYEENLQTVAENLGVSRKAVVKAVNRFRDVLEKYLWLECPLFEDRKFRLTSFGTKIIGWALKTEASKDIKDEEKVRVFTLAALVNWFNETHVPQNKLREANNLLVKSYAEKSELIKKIKELEEKLQLLEKKLAAAKREEETCKDAINKLQAMLYIIIKEQAETLCQITNSISRQ